MTLTELLSMPVLIAVEIYADLPEEFSNLPLTVKFRELDYAAGRAFDSHRAPLLNEAEIACGMMPGLIVLPRGRAGRN